MVVALGADVLLGEPPARLHPTVAMGRWIGALRARATGAPPLEALAMGAVGLAAGAAITAGVALAAEQLAGTLPRTTRPCVRGLALKPTLSLRALLAAGHAVERALARGHLRRARWLLGRHLVSRDTRTLAASEVAGATIESLAENLSDGLLAPLVYERLGGLAGAYVYRFVNTADAMIGYRTPELEYLGKAAARADDLLNLFPARLTALAICAAARAGRGSFARAMACAVRDAHRTPSPNAGWPMAAMAGALGCRLTKRSGGALLYALNPGGRAPRVADIARARRIVAAAAAIGVGVIAA
jgi:adenosylcobinamide-phosphate synthase